MLAASAAAPLALMVSSLGPAVAADAPSPTQLPSGGVVTAGGASLSSSGATLTITQTTARAAITWNSFAIGSAATVTFDQPSAASVTLNRVLSSDPARIFGRLDANGQVFLVDPAGVYFAPGASVEVGGLVAAAASLGDGDFMAGDDAFARNGATGAVVNAGVLAARSKGYIALLGPQVTNSGTIVARLGTVALAAGDAFTLRMADSRFLAGVVVSPATIATLVANGGGVMAPGGMILLSAQAANALQGGVVNNSGVLEADGLTGDGGTIRLTASGAIEQSGAISADAAPGGAGAGGAVTLIADLANAASRLDLSGSISAMGGAGGGPGGQVETSASEVRIEPGATVDTRAPGGAAGHWLLDPADFTVAASGGDVTAAQLESLLATNSVTIETTASGADTGSALYGTTPGTGAINIDQNLTWSNTSLSLIAAGAINVNAVMTAVGASLVLNSATGAVNMGLTGAGFTGQVNFVQADGVTPRSGSGFLTIDGQTYTVITQLGAQGSATGTDLQGINGRLSGYWALGADIDASATAQWNSGAGFKPIEGPYVIFEGVFNGLGHTIANLYINEPTTTYVGLFGNVQNDQISNVGLVDETVIGYEEVGGLVGRDTARGAGAVSTISDTYVTGSISATDFGVGGLVGRELSDTPSSDPATASISSSYSTASVTSANGGAGGLVAALDTGAPAARSSIVSSYATGAVSELGAGGSLVGGLVASANDMNNSQGVEIISNSFATGTVSAAANAADIGGLAGQLLSATVSQSYVTSQINTGAGTRYVGAVVGLFQASGLRGDFYDNQVNGSLTAIGSYSAADRLPDVAGQYWGMTTAELQDPANFTAATAANGDVDPGWNLGGAWIVTPGFNNGYPYLTALPTSAIIDAYVLLIPGASTYGSTPDLTYELYSNPTGAGGNAITTADPTGSAIWSTPLSAKTGAGSYSETYVGGLALAAGYELFAGDANVWTVNKAPLTVTAGSQSTTYGQALALGSSAFTASGLVNGDTVAAASLTFGGSATVPGTTSAGLYAGAIVAADATGSGLSNYVISYVPGDLTVNKAILTVTADNQSRFYGLANPTFTETVSGFVGGQTAASAGVTGSAVGSSAATPGSPPGVYTIVASVGSLEAADYLFVGQNGALTVKPAPPQPPPPSLGGAGFSAFTATEAGDLPDTVSMAETADASDTGAEAETAAAAPAPEAEAPGGAGAAAASENGAANGQANAAAAQASPAESASTQTGGQQAGASEGAGGHSIASSAAGAQAHRICRPGPGHPCPPARAQARRGRSPTPGAGAPKPVAPLAIEIRKRAQRMAQAAALAAARGNEPAPGDVMAQSFEQDVWLDNSDPGNVGKSHAARQYSQSLSNTNTMITFTLFLIP